MSNASGINLPLLVAGVFAATFLVVCALAYIFLGRSQSRTDRGAPSVPPAPDQPPPDVALFDQVAAASTVDGAAPTPVAIETISRRRPLPPVAPAMSLPASEKMTATPLDPGKATILRLYRLLMFLTGGTGLVAAYLMFTAVEGFSRLVVIALVVLALSLGALYRGFVPDPELTGRK